MATRFCTNCGVQRVEGAAFCPSCGAPAATAQPSVEPPPLPPDPPPPDPPPPQPQPQPQPQLQQSDVRSQPPIAAPPPLPPQATGQSKPVPWPLIIGGVLLLCAIGGGLAAVLLGRERDSTSYSDTWRDSDAPVSTSRPYAAPSAGATSTPAPRPVTMPSNARWFFGTWGPNCPTSTADSITFFTDGTFQASGSLGRWTIDSGSTITITVNGRTATSRWVFSSFNAATAYRMGTTGGQPIRRCS